jgi:cytoskeleton protein RodZ
MTIDEKLPPDNLGALFGVGDRLKSVRETRGLSLEDVSQTLKVSRKILEQIEANAWGELPGYTFARGIVRAYAKLVSVEAQPLLDELDSAPLLKRPLLELPMSTRAALPVPGQSRNRDKLAMLAGVLLVTLSVLVFFLVPEGWFNEQTAGIAPAATEQNAGLQQQQATLLEPASARGTEMASGAFVDKGTPLGVSVAIPLGLPAMEVAAPLPTPAAEKPILILNFVEASWVEVKDKNGVMLLSENVSAGLERSLTGSGPFNLALGNADGVNVSYRGQRVDLKPHTRQKVARLSLD